MLYLINLEDMKASIFSLIYRWKSKVSMIIMFWDAPGCCACAESSLNRVMGSYGSDGAHSTVLPGAPAVCCSSPDCCFNTEAVNVVNDLKRVGTTVHLLSPAEWTLPCIFESGGLQRCNCVELWVLLILEINWFILWLLNCSKVSLVPPSCRDIKGPFVLLRHVFYMLILWKASDRPVLTCLSTTDCRSVWTLHNE